MRIEIKVDGLLIDVYEKVVFVQGDEQLQEYRLKQWLKNINETFASKAFFTRLMHWKD